MIPSAKDMASAIWSNGEKLIQAGILDQSSYAALGRLRSELQQKGASTQWAISVPREEPFVFSRLKTPGQIEFHPVVSVDGIVTTTQGDHPFSKLDISLQMTCVDNAHHARWHFDMANQKADGTFQDGPLFHLQFGGRIPKVADFWLKPPRWAHAPMDLVMLLEAVAANFYTEKWTEALRQDPVWCENVSQSETMCLTTYMEKLREVLGTRSRTVLGSLWANA